MMCILFYLENIRSKKYTNKMWRNARRELLIMATKIKSKFKVGVALLCTLLMMISIIPTNIIGGWDVNAAGFTVYFNKSKYANDGGWGGATNIRVYAEFSDGTKIGPKDTDMSVVTTATDTIYSYTFTSKPSNFTLIYIDSSYNTSSKNYQEGTQWEGWPKSGQEWRQTQPVSLSDSDNNKCYYINGHSGNKKILAVDSSFVPPATSIEGSTVGFVDMTGSVGDVAYSFSGNSQTESAKADYSSAITIADTYKDYTTVNFYKKTVSGKDDGGNDTYIYELLDSYDLTDSSTGYDSSSTNTLYYGAKVTDGTINSYWGAARSASPSSIAGKTLYLDKKYFVGTLSATDTSEIVVNSTGAGNYSSKYTLNTAGLTTNSILETTVTNNGTTTTYRFFWDGTASDLLTVNENGFAVVSGIHNDTEKRIYFDSTFSKISYAGSSNNVKEMPLRTDGTKTIEYVAYKADNTVLSEGPMIPENPDDDDNNIYYVDLSTEAASIMFYCGETSVPTAVWEPNRDKTVIYFYNSGNWTGTVYAYVYDLKEGTSKNKEWPGVAMKSCGDKLYSYEVPSDIDNAVVIFNSSASQYPSGTNVDGLSVVNGKWYMASSTNGLGANITYRTTIPTDLQNPCYFADTSDDILYELGRRDGCWVEYGGVRNVETSKKTDIVKIDSTTFTPDSSTYYVMASMYDYYSDYELNGNDRVDHNTLTTGADNLYRLWYPFKQFDQALSDYYKGDNDSKTVVNSLNTIYTGHFQPNGTNGSTAWGGAYSNIANAFTLYGWSSDSNSDNHKAFESNNNSTRDWNSTDTTNLEEVDNAYYDYATQNIVAWNLGDNGIPTMYNNTTVDLPYFNKAFLTGSNSKNAVIGEVYENVAFPFTKVERDNDGIMYWSFDSAATTLKLKKNDDTNSKYEYFLNQESQAIVGGEEASHNRASDRTQADATRTGENGESMDWSKNVDSSNGIGSDGTSNTYGYFPLNNTSASTNGSQYNFGFGTRLDFDFTLTSDGTVKDKNDESKPITFNFSGDDDIWVFIDGKLALDLGGDHGRVSGCINFAKNVDYTYKYSFKPAKNPNKIDMKKTVSPASSYVSKVKISANNGTMYRDAKPSDVQNATGEQTASGGQITSIYTKLIDGYSKMSATEQEKAVEEFYSTPHTLTMFYMERGQWESNMKVQFNFPDSDNLNLQKTVDTTTNKVDGDFKPFFNDQSIFDYTIQNLATHYGEKKAVATVYAPITIATDFAGSVAKGSENTSSSNTMEKLSDYQGQTNVIHYHANLQNGSAAQNDWQNYTSQRLGVFDVDSGVDIGNIAYMTTLEFMVYSSGASGQLDPTSIYIKLTDTDSNTLYGYLSGDKKTASQWNMITVPLSSLTSTGFDITKIKSISVAYDYWDDLYFDEFKFVTTNVSTSVIGFTIDQSEIPDYGSATTGTLQPAVNAIYTSSYSVNPTGKNTNKQAIGAGGKVSLENGQMISFSNQFRLGSYVSITENLNTNQQKLFTQTWTMYDENGSKVSTMATGNKVTNPAGNTVTNPQENVTGFDDGRIEKVEETTKNAYTTAAKPNARTVVFRSYNAPDTSAVGITMSLVNTNIVNVGSLKISKAAAAGSEPLTGTYTFVVVFSNIGGIGLHNGDQTTVTKVRTLAAGADTTITGIPVGTEYVVYEIDSTDSSLKAVTDGGADVTSQIGSGSVTYTSGESTFTDKPAHYYSGSIGAANEADQLVFSNYKEELINLKLAKVWEGTPDGTELPDYAYFTLERKVDGGNWEQVSGYTHFFISSMSQNGQTTWGKDFNSLSAKNAAGKRYVYRVVEETYDSEKKKYTLLNPDGTLTNGTDMYKVAYDGDVYTNGTKIDNATITITNTYQAVPIIMPETGGNGQPFNYVLFGSIAVTLAGGALLIYRRKLKYAYHRAQVRGGDKR